MSATPIPRSLALTLYGDLDVSTLDEKPPGRLADRDARPARVRARGARFRRGRAARSRAGGQAYVVVPLIEESDRDRREGRREARRRDPEGAPGRRVGVVHGRIPPDERERTMAAFAGGKLDVLAATTVIEVGVDVPNASFLVVENAERFGLAQLHQLRGRVGRGRRKSRCVFLVGRRASPSRASGSRVLERDRRRLRRGRGGPEAPRPRRRARDAPERRAALPRRRPRPRRRAPPAGAKDEAARLVAGGARRARSSSRSSSAAAPARPGTDGSRAAPC